MPRYLVVDDSRTSRTLLAALLRKASSVPPDILEAASLDEALEAFSRTPPDVVFLDMQLDLHATGTGGGSSGLMALDAMLRERPEARVVLVTALTSDHPDVSDALAMGACALLEKPVASDQLRAALAEATPAQ
jgi:CheY-like chemotaxis protein